MLPATSKSYWASHQQRTFGWQCDSTNTNSLHPYWSCWWRYIENYRDIIRTKKRCCWARFWANIILLHTRTCLARTFTHRILAECTLKSTYTQHLHPSFTTILEITLQCACSWLDNTYKRTYMIFFGDHTQEPSLHPASLSSPSAQYANYSTASLCHKLLHKQLSVYTGSGLTNYM